jgi:hypothetical protein
MRLRILADGPPFPILRSSFPITKRGCPIFVFSARVRCCCSLHWFWLLLIFSCRLFSGRSAAILRSRAASVVCPS